MKLTPPALFSATKSDFTESATSFKLFKVREGPDFISGFTLCASSSSLRGIPVVADGNLRERVGLTSEEGLLFVSNDVKISSVIYREEFKVGLIKARSARGSCLKMWSSGGHHPAAQLGGTRGF